MYDSWVACRHTPGSTIKTSTIKVIYHNNRPDDAAVSHITQSLHDLWPARLVGYIGIQGIKSLVRWGVIIGSWGNKRKKKKKKKKKKKEKSMSKNS